LLKKGKNGIINQWIKTNMDKQKIPSFLGKTLFAAVNIMSIAGTALAQDTLENANKGGAASNDLSNPYVSTTSFNVNRYLSAPGQNLSNVIGEGKNPVGSYLIRLINFLSLMIGSVAFLAIIVGGIVLLTSAGNQNMTTKGKDMIKYAIIGLVVALCAYLITAAVQSIFYEYGTVQ
jgi:hypothetical protein